MFTKLRELSKNITVYGLGDVAVSLVNFALLGLYVKYFDATAYGVIGLLGVLEVVLKIVFRFGLDGSFMRLFYDDDRPEARRRLASTIFFFLLALNGALVLALLLAAPALAAWLLGGQEYTTALRLMLVNTDVSADCRLQIADRRNADCRLKIDRVWIEDWSADY